AVGVALHKLYLSRDRCTNEEYEALMERTMREYCAAGVSAVAFGDIFLEDLRAYRERNLARVGMRGVFPIWHRDTTELVRTFIGLGFRAYLACVDGTKLGQGFCGRAIDGTLLRDLPAEVDPCGENGEFHSFVYDGPIFRRPVPVTVGEVVARDIRYFADLLPGDHPAAVASVPRVGGYLAPSVEVTLARRPDLVIAAPSPGNREAVRAIERAGVRVLVVHDRTLADLWASIRAVAGALGTPAAGERLVADVAARLGEVRARVADLPPRRVLVIVGHRPLVAVGRGTLQDELLTVAGGVNVAADAGRVWPTRTLELVVARAPEVIV